MATINAVYKRYVGEENGVKLFDVIHFQTNVGQVG